MAVAAGGFARVAREPEVAGRACLTCSAGLAWSNPSVLARFGLGVSAGVAGVSTGAASLAGLAALALAAVGFLARAKSSSLASQTVHVGLRLRTWLH